MKGSSKRASALKSQDEILTELELSFIWKKQRN